MSYYLPTKIIFGEKTFRQLFTELKSLGAKKPLIICGRHFLGSTKFNDIKDNIARYSLVSGIPENPSIRAVDVVAKKMNLEGCDAVIGIGGGSVLDTSKLVSAMKGIKKSCKSFYGKAKFSKGNKIPFIAIPTTSGSGSEATKYSVLTLENGVKKSLSDDLLYADVAIVDPELTNTCPARTTAASGIDAFCQGFEGYWAKNSTQKSREFSAEAIRLAYANLEAAVKFPNRAVRYNMANASLSSARGFSQTGTTGCHQLSYAWTRYYGLVHGFAVAITLPWFLEFYSQAEPQRCLELCGFLGAKNIDEGRQKITSLLESIGAPVRLRDIGFKMEDSQKVIEMCLSRRPQSPRAHTRADLMRLIGELY